jgi:hypothetical protein
LVKGWCIGWGVKTAGKTKGAPRPLLKNQVVIFLLDLYTYYAYGVDLLHGPCGATLKIMAAGPLSDPPLPGQLFLLLALLKIKNKNVRQLLI